MERTNDKTQEKIDAIRDLVVYSFGYVHTSPDVALEEFVGRLRAILEDTRFKLAAGTHVRYRDYRAAETAPMDRTGIIEKWGSKWVTIKNDETGKTEWSTLTGCEQLPLTQDTQTEETTAQNPTTTASTRKAQGKRNRKERAK